MANEPPFNSPEERADAWARALHWGTPEQLRARGIEPPSISGHVCDENCAHTIDIGHVHVLTDDRSTCRPDCPHPDHA